MDTPGAVLLRRKGDAPFTRHRPNIAGGCAKGAKREEPDGLDPMITFFGAIPYSGNSTVVLASRLNVGK